jgi:hypothetical protein
VVDTIAHVEIDVVEESRTTDFHFNPTALNGPSSMHCPSMTRLSDFASFILPLSAFAINFK